MHLANVAQIEGPLPILCRLAFMLRGAEDTYHTVLPWFIIQRTGRLAYPRGIPRWKDGVGMVSIFETSETINLLVDSTLKKVEGGQSFNTFRILLGRGSATLSRLGRSMSYEERGN